MELFDFEGALPLFERFIEFVPDGVLGVRENGDIAIANSHAERLFGYEREGLVGRPLASLIPERFRHAHAHFLNVFFDDPHMRPMNSGIELHALRADGSEFRVDISLSVIQTGRASLALAFVRDMSPRRSVSRHDSAEITVDNFFARLEAGDDVAGTPRNGGRRD